MREKTLRESSGSEPVSSLLPAVTAPGGSRPGPDKRGEVRMGHPERVRAGLHPAGLVAPDTSASPPLRGEQGATAGLIGEAVSPASRLSVGEGVSGDFLGTAAGAGTAAPPRRTKNELIRPIEGEECWRCALPASVVVIGSHGAPWPYCEGHGIDRMAAEFLAQKYEARRGEWK